MKTIDFYFDFMSPFSYLANVKLPDLAEKSNARLVYYPIDIPSAKLAAGNYGPSNREVKPKIAVMLPDIKRWCALYNVPFKFPKDLDCTIWNTASLFAKEHGDIAAFVNEGFHRIWGCGIDATDQSELRKSADKIGLNSNELLDYVNSTKGSVDFKKACVNAFEKGIFGAPIMVVDDQYFWGNDRLDFLEGYLNGDIPPV